MFTIFLYGNNKNKERKLFHLEQFYVGTLVQNGLIIKNFYIKKIYVSFSN